MYLSGLKTVPACSSVAMAIIILCFSSESYSQAYANPQLDLQVAAKLLYHLGYNGDGGLKESGGHFTLSLSAGTAIRSKKNSNAAILLQSGINLYAKGLGTNMIGTYVYKDSSGRSHETRRKLEIDFVNSVAVNAEFGPDMPNTHRYLFPLTFFNQMTATPITAFKHYNIFYGTTFLFNTSHRNQQIGFFGVQTPWVSIGSYNDCCFGNIVGDQLDRFWTGGFHLKVKPYFIKKDPSLFKTDNVKANKLSFELRYDRFTYDVQDALRLSDIFLIPYALEPNFYNLFYNNSLTTFTVNYENYTMGFSILGKTNWDLQDVIHRIKGVPRHKTYNKKQYLGTIGYSPSF